ncbi:helix-turn-helix domain-containing protein [Kribbella sp.]|uniref:helix-turn-helix domain-containing protein n=1 Tax=Kribbella sp. TaxID=1871183 RepID=UPI002D3FF872|nr:helix-turn-helix domain-containing protein [Kribbella sp.]HZX02479.1 helix-turn-helix domain-containing protein [Kribbella sp.]
MLERLGIDAEQEQVYEHVLTHPGRTAAEVAQELGGADLDALVAKGLLRVDSGRYSAVPPALTLQGLLDARQLELDRAAARVRELERLHSAAPYGALPAPVEVVPGHQAHDYLMAIHRATRSEVRAFETPPYVKPISVEDAQPVAAAIQHGVAHRIVYSRAAVDEQGLDTLLVTLSVGEQARVTGDVPMRLAIYDDRIATLPAVTGTRTDEGLLVVRPSALLDALIALFERVWASALPLTLTAEEPVEAAEAEDRILIALLSAGMSDQAIARQLGISLRTVGRRIQRVQNGLHAQTRFQAGVAVGLARPGAVPGPR